MKYLELEFFLTNVNFIVFTWGVANYIELYHYFELKF